MKRTLTLWPLMVAVSFFMGVMALPALAVPPNPNPVFVPTGFTANLYSSDVAAIHLSSPTAMAFAPDGRLFVAEQQGGIRILLGELNLLAAPFYTVPTVVPDLSVGDERGLIGLALDPNFATTGFVYVNYTVDDGTNLFNRVSRIRANPSSSNVADLTFGVGDGDGVDGEQVLFEMSTLSTALTHVGGSIHFGPDGTLYIATGENEDGPQAQDMTVTHGKILRINSDGSIPADNPFLATTTGINQSIWAIGLRNPFQMSFRDSDGLFYVNDVGGGDWEEIDRGIAGANYGWPNYDGPDLVGAPIAGERQAEYIYSHTATGGCAVTGGTFYNGANYPAAYVGDYFYADYCGGWAASYDVTSGLSTPFFSGYNFGMVGMAVSPDGELYVLRRTGGGTRGTVMRVRYFEVIQDPVDTTVVEGNDATFTCAAQGGTAPITYQWQRDSITIPTATSATYTLTGTSLSDDGAQFTCIATDSTPGTPLTDTSAIATLTVSAATPTPIPTATAVTSTSVPGLQGSPQVDVADPALSKVGLLLPDELGVVGERLQWDVTVTNRGTASALNVVVTDTLRSELRIDDVRTSQGTKSTSGQTVSVTFAEIKPGETFTFSIITTVLSSNITVDNTACLTADGIGQRCTTAAPLRTGAPIQQLPSTGETPPWRAPLLMTFGLILITLILGGLGIAWLGWRKLERAQDREG